MVFEWIWWGIRFSVELYVRCPGDSSATHLLFYRSCIIASQETCTKWAVAASWKWCILGTTRWGFGPPRWLGTDPGPSPRTSTSRTQVRLKGGPAWVPASKCHLNSLVFFHLQPVSLSLWNVLTGDPLYIVKIVIGPIICSVLLLLVAVGGFVMFKKK